MIFLGKNKAKNSKCSLRNEIEYNHNTNTAKIYETRLFKITSKTSRNFFQVQCHFQVNFKQKSYRIFTPSPFWPFWNYSKVFLHKMDSKINLFGLKFLSLTYFMRLPKMTTFALTNLKTDFYHFSANNLSSCGIIQMLKSPLIISQVVLILKSYVFFWHLHLRGILADMVWLFQVRIMNVGIRICGYFCESILHQNCYWKQKRDVYIWYIWYLKNYILTHTIWTQNLYIRKYLLKLYIFCQ